MYQVFSEHNEKEIFTMKKFLALTMAMAMVLGLTACSGSSDKNTSDSTSTSGDSSTVTLTTVTPGKLTMSTNAQFPPYEMVASDGSFEGIDIEVAQAIADQLGLELVIDDMGFDAALQAVQTGKSDMVMAGVTVNEDRLAVMDFSQSYANGVQVVIIKEGSDVTMDNLGEQMIGCQMGTTGYIYCSDSVENGGFGDDHVIPYDDGSAAIQALLNGQVDAVVIDNAPAQEYVSANAGLTILDGEWVDEDYAIGFAKGNTALETAVNNALQTLSDNGTLQSIVDKYIPAN
jgi:polar amino acid transport system substrate-binding protein